MMNTVAPVWDGNETWLSLVTGQTNWGDAVERGLVAASGLRADLSTELPF